MLVDKIIELDVSWEKSEMEISGNMIVDDEGTLYLVTKDRSLRAIYPDGSYKWVLDFVGVEELYSPSFDNERNLVFVVTKGIPKNPGVDINGSIVNDNNFYINVISAKFGNFQDLILVKELKGLSEDLKDIIVSFYEDKFYLYVRTDNGACFIDPINKLDFDNNKLIIINKAGDTVFESKNVFSPVILSNGDLCYFSKDKLGVPEKESSYSYYIFEESKERKKTDAKIILTYVSNEGKQKWTHTLEENNEVLQIASSIAVDCEDNLWFLTQENYLPPALYCFDVKEQKLIRKGEISGIESGVNVFGTALYSPFDKAILSLNKLSSPIIDNEGNVYFGVVIPGKGKHPEHSEEQYFAYNLVIKYDKEMNYCGVIFNRGVYNAFGEYEEERFLITQLIGDDKSVYNLLGEYKNEVLQFFNFIIFEKKALGLVPEIYTPLENLSNVKSNLVILGNKKLYLYDGEDKLTAYDISANGFIDGPWYNQFGNKYGNFRVINKNKQKTENVIENLQEQEYKYKEVTKVIFRENSDGTHKIIPMLYFDNEWKETDAIVFKAKEQVKYIYFINKDVSPIPLSELIKEIESFSWTTYIKYGDRYFVLSDNNLEEIDETHVKSELIISIDEIEQDDGINLLTELDDEDYGTKIAKNILKLSVVNIRYSKLFPKYFKNSDLSFCYNYKPDFFDLEIFGDNKEEFLLKLYCDSILKNELYLCISIKIDTFQGELIPVTYSYGEDTNYYSDFRIMSTILSDIYDDNRYYDFNLVAKKYEEEEYEDEEYEDEEYEDEEYEDEEYEEEEYEEEEEEHEEEEEYEEEEYEEEDEEYEDEEYEDEDTDNEPEDKEGE